MKMPNWGQLFHALQKAVDDYKANKPRPQSATPTGADLAAGLRAFQTKIPALIAWAEANPGAITAADDILAALEAQGQSWAGIVRAGVDAAPSALSEAEKAIPTVLWFLGDAFKPAATGITGDHQGTGPRIGRG